VFRPGFGRDAVADFYTTGKLEFHGTRWTSAADVLRDAAQVGANVVISLDANNSVTLEAVRLTTLQQHHEVFVLL